MSLINEKQNHKPTFSVIIPAYNSQDFIDKSVNSVLSQTCTDFELVLVDDGSKDNTLKIFNKFAENDSRIKVIHQDNGGHTSARNTGLLNSVGEYILFIDSDDSIETNVLERIKDEIVINNPDVIVFDILQCNLDAKYSVLPNKVNEGFYNLKKDKFVIENLIMSNQGDFSFQKSLIGKCFRREYILKTQLSLPKNILVGEDGASFVLTVLECETVMVISNVFYRYTIRDGSVSHSSDKLAFDRYLSLINFYLENVDVSNNQLVEQLQRFAVAHLYTVLQFVMRSDCSKSYLKKIFRKIVSNEFVKSSIKNAKFDNIGIKMKIKQLILRHRLFFLVKPLSFLTHL